MGFPQQRPRRTRASAAWRRLVRETRLTPDAFVYPLFVVPGRATRHAVASMPGICQLSVDEAVKEARSAAASGVPAVLLFAAPERKDARASDALDARGLAAEAIGAIKAACPDLLVWADVCLCGATDHGHCGHVSPGGVIDNDSSLETLAQVALNYARAGADAVAPSDMMDGRVGAIREALDDRGFETTPILAYSAKYASAFYGPFREAADSAPAFGDRRGYQLDPANVREALRECKIDLAEGADAIMIKPALPYLDVIRAAREAFQVPLAAYNVSGEYAMVKAAARAGWLDERAAALESLTAIKRAGADLIVSYWTRDLAAWL